MRSDKAKDLAAEKKAARRKQRREEKKFEFAPEPEWLGDLMAHEREDAGDRWASQFLEG